jgi:DNA-binding NarL/FixJ family response regulator
VREASDGHSALPLIEEGVHFDLLFTDIGSPAGMNGFELAERMRQLLPRVEVLYTAGYGSHGGRYGSQEVDQNSYCSVSAGYVAGSFELESPSSGTPTISAKAARNFISGAPTATHFSSRHR